MRSPQAVGAGKSTPDKTKKLKKAEGKEYPQAMVVEAKAALDRAKKARNEVKEQVDMLCMQIVQLYGNLLTNEACQPWEKIVKIPTNTVTWEDLWGKVHEEKAGKI
jgi:hypothetical protein